MEDETKTLESTRPGYGTMESLRSIFRRKSNLDQYEPIIAEEGTALEGSVVLDGQDEVPFSWWEYSIFALLGMAMLWAWNMFLAAAPYFQMRFQDDIWITQNFQSAILTVSTITNLAAMIILTNIQYTASYPFRINLALVLNIVVFALLTLSTVFVLDASPQLYLAFLLPMVGCTAWATGLIQNGAFAFAASFGRPEYMQALMAGQGVAGVLPPVAQIATVLMVPSSGNNDVPPDGDERDSGVGDDGSSSGGFGSSATIYFLTAVLVSVVALAAFVPLVKRHNHIVENRMIEHMAESMHSVEEAERAARKVTSMGKMVKKLGWLAAAIFMTFAISMYFPVLTSKVVSVRYPGEEDHLPPILQPAAFIPLGFFWWNLGDLMGRMATSLPFSLRQWPVALFGLSITRVMFLPLYLLCNIGGRGAIISSDIFYLLAVQFPFGLTNGWLGASCMMAAGEWVDEGEREAAGGFMGLCLVAGLTAGSMLSFTAAGI